MDLRQEMALDIAAALSKSHSKKITKQTIRYMQSFDTALDMGYLRNLWDDVCYQRQKEQAPFWSYYDDMILQSVSSKLEKLSQHEIYAIWLQDPNLYYQLDDIDIGKEHIDKSPPYCVDDISRYIMNEYIYREAESWRNDRLRQLLGYF
ncbi:hypothetical protein [Psychrobacter sp. UBA3480]|jgi:hypothetical protein|nr:hypothetical protein [Psychrobacter sp. UBA3480]